MSSTSASEFVLNKKNNNTMAFVSGVWKSFLMEAGIEKNLVSEYSLIFSKNRIDISTMLPELTKEYLNAMKIEAIGDIIRIIRHSKIVTDRNFLSPNSVKVLEEKQEVRIKPKAPSSVSSSCKLYECFKA